MKKWGVILLLIWTSACVDLTSQHFNPQKHSSAQAQVYTEKKALKGDLYALRGLLGIFSRGVDTLSLRAYQDYGIAASSLSYLEVPKLADYIINQRKNGNNKQPLILVGHSLGADGTILLAERLNQAHIPVDLIVTLDAVNPHKVPPNVKKAVNLYMPHAFDKAPVFRGIPIVAEDPTKTKILNMNVGQSHLQINKGDTNHLNIDKGQGIQDYVFAVVKQTIREKGNN